MICDFLIHNPSIPYTGADKLSREDFRCYMTRCLEKGLLKGYTIEQIMSAWDRVEEFEKEAERLFMAPRDIKDDKTGGPTADPR